MAENIIQSLRALASKIENLGEGADRIISNDEGLASDFQELLKVVPAKWKKSGENRLFSQLQKKAKDISINERHREVIWSWKKTHEDFCSRQARTTIDPHNTPALDGLIDGIESDDTDLILSSVHWRISLLVITLVKDVVCKDITDDTEITTCFQSNGLVSTEKLNYLNKNMRRWVEAGAKYRDLSLKLGGYGSLIYLPDIGRTNYEKYYNPTQNSAFAVIGVLARSIPPAAAQSFDGINAHNVVDAIIQSTIDRLNDCRLIIISTPHVGTQQPRRTTRVERCRVKNQSSQTRKRSNKNSQNTPGSKRRRVDVRRAGTGAATTICGANTNNDNNGARQSEPSAEEVVLALWNFRDGRPNLSVNEQSLTACRRIAHDSSPEVRNPSVSIAGSTTSSTQAAKTTSEVDDGSNRMSSETTSVNSMSGESSRQLISSFAAGCNPPFQAVNDGLSTEQADLLPSTFRNQQVVSADSTYRGSVQQDSEVLRHPVQYSQGMETNQYYANYAQLADTQQPASAPNDIVTALPDFFAQDLFGQSLLEPPAPNARALPEFFAQDLFGESLQELQAPNAAALPDFFAQDLFGQSLLEPPAPNAAALPDFFAQDLFGQSFGA